MSDSTRNLFCVFSIAQWVAEDFRKGMNRKKWDLIHSYGLDVPYEVQNRMEDNKPVSYWMPAALAARLKRTSYAPRLTAPPKNILSVLPKEVTGRQVETVTLKEFKKRSFESKLFLKPAEAKLDYFPAQEVNWDDLGWLITPDNPLLFPQDMLVQYTTSILKLNHEHRFYILNGEPVTGSAYLVDGVTFYDSNDQSIYQKRLREAEDFVCSIIPLMPDMPEGYVLDVAFNEITKNWIVLETNPAWCSGVYGSDINAVMDTIEASCNPADPYHVWEPDPVLANRALRQPILPYQTS